MARKQVFGIAGGASGTASILGSWQVCHNLCLGVVALLAIIGITVTGMPLMFLTRLAVPLWSLAFLLLIFTAVLYFKKRCISGNLILLNSGLVTMGVPFQSLQAFSPIFWAIGGGLAAIAVVLFAKRIKNLETYMLYGLLALAISVLIFAVFGFTTIAGAQRGIDTLESKALGAIASGSTAAGDVSIVLTPEIGKQLKVKIDVNTHSVDLGQFDLKQITSLEYGLQSVKPVSVPALSGHHSSGEIIFSLGEELNTLDSFTIRIKGIPKVQERVFTWEMKER